MEALKEEGIDGTFISAVYLGIGGFNLMLSILPSRVLRLVEVLGFAGNRDFGMVRTVHTPASRLIVRRRAWR